MVDPAGGLPAPAKSWPESCRGRRWRRCQRVLWAGAVAVGLAVVSVVGSTRPAVAAVAPCSYTSVNPIPCENSKTGTPASVWNNFNGAGDANLQGFATDISVNVGGTVSFKVNSGNYTSYTIDIYRLGYYQGNGARKVGSTIPSVPLPQKQPACLTDVLTGLIDCGNWGVSATWTVPYNAVSGIYVALLTAPSGGQSHIVFVVRNDNVTSDILFKTNDTTWEAYNDYGGNSLYYGIAPSSNGRAYKVSYNRPFNLENEGTGYGAANWVFYGEYPMLRWLEANGYNVSYTTSVDVERYPTLLTNHKVILASGHDEYWSAGERGALQAARDAGVSLALFTGNDSFWKVRWENAIDGSNTPYRTLVCYKETRDNKVLDPQDPPTWTGTWRDPRFSPPADGGKPENGLLGNIFMVNRGSAAPVLTAGFAKLRFWRNTAVAGLTGSQTVTLGAQTIGYEWDEDLDNGFRPAGLVDLSSTTVSVPELLQDYGNTYVPGTAVHHLTMYRVASGALVFDAGTVQWAWGLDINHDTGPDVGPDTPNSNMQQATVNLLADMHVQPATLQPGLVAATASNDTAPPISSIASPVSGTTLTSGSTVTVTGTAVDSGGGVVAGVEVSVDGGITWHPANGTGNWSYSWTPGAPGSVTLKSRAVDDSGNLESPSAGVTVTVNPRTCPCSLFTPSMTPVTANSQDATPVELGVKFYVDTPGYVTGIMFYKGSSNTGTHTGSLWTSSGTLLATGTFTNETSSGWQTLAFASPVTVQANTTYVASYHTTTGYYSSTIGFFTNQYDAWPMHALGGSNGVYAYGGSQFPTQTYNATNYWVDVAFNSPYVTTPNPTVVITSPASGANNVGIGSPVSASFNKNVVASSVQFTLTGANSAQVAGTVSYNSTTYTMSFTPSSPLALGTQYTATVGGASDSSGNTMTGPYSWSFSTRSCPCSLFASSATPGNPSVNDPNAVELGVKFTSEVAGYVNGIRFYKGSANSGPHVGDLWTSSGLLLASATFSNETASGWQQVLFSKPVAISAGTVYVASYHTSSGNYAADGGYFANSLDNSPLHASASGSVTGNGVYAYGASQFPAQTFNATNYWVDVVFNTTYVDTVPPAVTSVSPVANATGVVPTTVVTATFSKGVVASSIAFKLADPSGGLVAGSTSYNSANLTASFQPSASLGWGKTYTATVSGATDPSGNIMSPYSWSFTTIPCPCSLFPTSATPATVTVNDANAVELGMKFTVSANGTVTGVRFYKGSSNTGIHVGNLWSSSGQLLASVTFTNETASGWQQANFSTPVPITAGTVYVISYHTNVGYYSVTAGYFNSAISNPPLQAPASGSVGGNGVYSYGASQFPTSTFNANNYWVDVIFSPS